MGIGLGLGFRIQGLGFRALEVVGAQRAGVPDMEGFLSTLDKHTQR